MLIEMLKTECGQELRIIESDGDDTDRGVEPGLWYWEPEDYDGDVLWDGPYESRDDVLSAIDGTPCKCGRCCPV